MQTRVLGSKILSWARQYPVITVTGPRQSGKTTLCKMLFPDKPYVNLEDIQERSIAKEDPRGFLRRFPHGVILDEIQQVPELLSEVQVRVDAEEEPGRYILSGSQQFELLDTVSQSLAGRTAIARLLPFSYSELYTDRPAPSLNSLLYQGFFPRIHDKKLNPTEAMSFYFSTYIERDIRQTLAIRDFAQFNVFVRLLAGRSAQVLNVMSLAGECGISSHTAKSWLHALELAGLVYLQQPFNANLGKRLIKSPRLHFLDSGLQCYLLNITEPGHLESHPLRGQIFESYVITELLKSLWNRANSIPLLYYRDSSGLEADALQEVGGQYMGIEIKSSSTFHPDFLSSLNRVEAALKCPLRKFVAMGTTGPGYSFKDSQVLGYDRLEGILSNPV